MYLNSGSCLELFNMLKSQGKTQKDLYDAIFTSIEPQDETDYIPSNIKAGRADVPSAIKKALFDTDNRPKQLIRFKKKVIPLFTGNLHTLIGAFILFIEKDKTITNEVIIANRKAHEWKEYEGTVFVESFLLDVITFAFSRGNNNCCPTDGLNDSFLKKARIKGKKIEPQEEISVLSPLQKNIPEDSKFQAVFHEVPLDQKSDNVKLRLFHLDPDFNRYSYEGLVRYFKENLFRHIHTLNEINGYKNEGRIATLHMDARTKLEERYNEENSDVLETLFVEACITDASNAPKIVNILEHDSNGIPSGSHGIHYLRRTNSTDNKIIVAISAIMNTGEEAITKALSDITSIASSDKYWRTRLFSQSCLNSKMPPEDAKLIASIFMPKPSNQREIQIVYGIFIGYFGESPDATDTLGARLSREVHKLERIIHKQIELLKLNSLELGFYFVPLNNPDNDKLKIVEEVLH